MICDILNGHPDKGYDHFRMTTTTFVTLRDMLVARGLIRGTRYMTVDEQLAIFLFGIGHGVANRVLAETFQHSGETISRHFNNVLRAIVMLKDEYLTLPPNNAMVHQRIRDNLNFYPFKTRTYSSDCSEERPTTIPMSQRVGKDQQLICVYFGGLATQEVLQFRMLRNVVEKTFGILKKRFKILNHATPFPQQENDMFNEEIEQLPTSDDDEDPPNIAGADESRCGDSLRRTITEQLWNNRC
ncbi:hypothetical protein ACMD2_17812 [Ananas comosus]|uniref:DUF8040 domain-containing protein n=1 Tax=Ananas comosus TaxID=4615 RepID=A0A199UYN4_ANACO|nr:hypothetical protein ACMD2_17812 [Ananas comosus]